MAKAVCSDPSYRQCHWIVVEIDILLHPIEVHVEAATSIRNHCKEALTLIIREWIVDAEEYIHCQGLVEQSLKLITSIANRRDVPDLKTGLLLANTQAVRQIIEGKTFHSRCLFLKPQDWQLCKQNPVPSRDLFDEKLYNAGIHLNLAREICADRLFLSMPGRTITNMPASTTSMPAATLSTLPAPAFTTSPHPAPPTLSTLPPISRTSAPTIATTAPTMSILLLTTSSSTPTPSALTYPRPKVVSVEEEEKSDFEDPACLVSEVPALPVSGVLALPVFGVPTLLVSGVLALSVSGVPALPVSGVSGLPTSEVSD